MIAELRDPDQPPPGLLVRTRIGPIVTGSVAISELEQVRGHPNVVALRGAVRLRPQLAHSVADIGADPPTLQQALPGRVLDGRGVVIGVVDLGCDFAHPHFIRDGQSRILFLWDQQRTQEGGNLADAPREFSYGREFTRDRLTAALSQPNPYAFLGYRLKESAHGTHILDVAGGNNPSAPGVAPGADLIFVDVNVDDIAWRGPGVVGYTYGTSVKLVEAVHYIFQKAGPRPCVVNISLGTNGGPHDGSSLVERAFDELLKQPGRAIVIAAGNSQQHRIHSSGRLAAGEMATLEWELPQSDPSDNEMEIWYSGSDEFLVEVVDHNGVVWGPLSAGSMQEGPPPPPQGPGGPIQVHIAHHGNDALNHDNHVGLFVAGGTLGVGVGRAIWHVRLHAQQVQTGEYHAWIERDDGDDAVPSCFGPASSATSFSHTLGSIASGRQTIVVGSYAAEEGRPISDFSSAGPTRDNRQKPELAAPGFNVVAASARTGGVVSMSGTSMAAPHVAGVAALLFQLELDLRGRLLTNEELRTVLFQTAQTSPAWPSAQERYGHGGVNAQAAIRRLAQGL